ncbi:MAG: hypothetical protein KME40_25415 [Komarekiella atlantica HA4396-MV6]|jgi:hypothetical protein|nr:hypothetical protein [Komarekiella atlantica HA4396-MV6]
MTVNVTVYIAIRFSQASLSSLCVLCALAVACLEKLSHCVGRVSRLVASGVPRLGNPVRMIASPLLYETLRVYVKRLTLVTEF